MVKRYISIFLLLVLAAGPAFAGGFQLNVQGGRQLGMAHTGTGLATDGAGLFFNPGSIVFLDSGWQIVGGVSLLMPRTIYVEPAPGNYRTYMVAHTATPVHFYATYHPASFSRMAFGIGVYNPYGSSAAWPSSWKGQFIIRSISLETFYIQPTAAFKISDWLSAGAGFVYASGSFRLEKGIPVQNQSAEYGTASLSGGASGFGWNGGLYAKFGEHWSAGLSMRSGVKVEVGSGRADFTVPTDLKDYFPDGSFTTKLHLPSTITAGIGYTTGKWKFALDINRTGWSSYDTLSIDFATNTDKLEDVHSARMYKDVFTFRAGANYSLNDKLDLRAGVYFDQTPVQDGYLTPETPDSDRIGLTCGATYSLPSQFRLSLFGLYTQGGLRTDTNLETGFSGSYKTIAVGFGGGITYSF